MSFARRGCYKCGNVGHYADACQEAERLCYNCKQPGHESNQCPQPRTAEQKQCYGCGGVGHLQADCPNLRVGTAASGPRCYSCGRLGHMARNCPSSGLPGGFGGRIPFAPRAPGFGGPGAGFAGGGTRVVCYKCGGYNHFARDCQANGVKCYSCGKFGHISRECPTGSTLGTGMNPGDKSLKTCYRCGERGHISKDCPNGNA